MVCAREYVYVTSPPSYKILRISLKKKKEKNPLSKKT